MNVIRSRSSGFTLVEMLVALVVLSVGMLGVAGLFVVSLRSGGSAISRMQAVNLASDIADRIRANRRAGVAYQASDTDTGTDNNCVGTGSVVCTPQQMAATDILLWKQAIAATFPGGAATGSIAYAAGELTTLPSTYTITVSWHEQGQAGTTTDSTQSVVMQIQAPLN